MDEKIDKKTEATLMKGLENAKAFGQRLQENREKRLWRKVNIPCSLHQAINGLTKDESEHYRLTDQEVNEIASQIINMINSDSKPTMIIQYLQSWLEFPSFEFAQVLTEKIMELYNNTRQWVLKGHTPNELFQKEKRFLKPLPAEPFKESQSNAKVIDLAARTKVGRNDPY